MKRRLSVFLAVLMIVVFAACGGGSPVDAVVKTTGATKEQAEDILDTLSNCDIEFSSISKGKLESTGDPDIDALVEEFSQYMEPYDVKAKDGKTYRIVLDADGKGIISIVDSDTGDFVY